MEHVVVPVYMEKDIKNRIANAKNIKVEIQ
jgi:hypothetical protein